ncbi:MAG: terpene cyclase/mutase family protein, partial [Pirellulales bacterium]|nr:terpene cyclase/mutase family protein [Pirellulales bacterium]
IFHATLLVLLALSFEVYQGLGPTGGLTLLPNTPVKLETQTPEPPQPDPITNDQVLGQAVPMPMETMRPRVGQLGPLLRDPNTTPIRPPHPSGTEPAQLERPGRFGLPGGLGGRGRDARSQLAQEDGGTPDSERAVERALRWLAAQQHEDGSWTFYHLESTSPGYQYRNPGTELSTTAATALVLLPFLGAGYTHRDGEHAETIHRALYYLNNKAVVTGQGLDLRDGTMYGQGLATIALCEAFAMSGDPDLRGLAQGAIDFVVFAQNKPGGGWRYMPGEPGDTTVTGWQVMALKSGLMAKLNVPTPTIDLANRFLDSVESEYGALYGYQTPTPRRSTTSIGLLCRMYSGWGRDMSPLARGVDYLDKWGPSKTDLYYDYYATQVLRHAGGRPWPRWNRTIRDYLVQTQSNEGLENGSWYFPDRHGDKGGRLYNTAMACMILEVYYRYLPLYKPKAVE